MIKTIRRLYYVIFLCIGLVCGVGYHFSIERAYAAGQTEILMTMPFGALVQMDIN